MYTTTAYGQVAGRADCTPPSIKHGRGEPYNWRPESPVTRESDGTA